MRLAIVKNKNGKKVDSYHQKYAWSEKTSAWAKKRGYKFIVTDLTIHGVWVDYFLKEDCNGKA